MPTASRGSLQALRQANQSILLSLLREHGAMHRAELARRAGVSRTTVSTIVTSLLADGLIVEMPGGGRWQGSAGPAAGAGRESIGARHASERRDGRAGGLLTLNPSAGIVLGIDFSYRQVRVIAADLAHTVLAEQAADIPPDQAWQENLELAARLADSTLAEAGAERGRVLGAGLGVPGPVDLGRQLVGFSSNSAGWAGSHAAGELARQLGVPVTMDNTSHLGCLAEAVWGAGTGCPNLVYLKLGAGVGSGLVIDGRIYRGMIGAAGEIGHLSVDDSGPACRCGGRGCLEIYAGVPAVLAALRPLLGDDVAVPGVLAAARAGNRAAVRVLADTGHVLGRAMASVCNLLNPGRIVVGGDLAPAGDLLLKPLREALDRQALRITAETVDVVPAALGDQAGALGGVALVLREGGWLTGQGTH